MVAPIAHMSSYIVEKSCCELDMLLIFELTRSYAFVVRINVATTSRKSGH